MASQRPKKSHWFFVFSPTQWYFIVTIAVAAASYLTLSTTPYRVDSQLFQGNLYINAR